MKSSTRAKLKRTILLVGLGIVSSLILNQDSKLENMENEFPTLTGNNLNREEVTIPNDLNEKPLLVILAFEQYHQRTVDEIIYQIEGEVSPSSINIIETPVLAGSSKLFQSYLDGIMRGGIKDYDIRARTITIYGKKDEILEQLKIEDQNVYWYLIGKDTSTILLSGMNTLSKSQLNDFGRNINDYRKPKSLCYSS